jgi:hypothetical protein
MHWHRSARDELSSLGLRVPTRMIGAQRGSQTPEVHDCPGWHGPDAEQDCPVMCCLSVVNVKYDE